MTATTLRNPTIHIVKLGVRLVGVFLLMLLAFVVSGMVTGGSTPQADPADAQNEMMALLFVSLVNSLVYAYLILRSHWYGWKLAGALLLIQFGVETFMSQIESLFFNAALAISAQQMIDIFLVGFLRALIFAPLAVWVLGKGREHAAGEPAEPRPALPLRVWMGRLVFLAAAYVLIYFLFGYFVAWQWPETRQFYTGSTAKLPFLEHMAGVLTYSPDLALFQLLRGFLWAALAIPVLGVGTRLGTGSVSTRLMGTRLSSRWGAALAVALVFGFPLAALITFPNPYMPVIVRLSHMVELFTSMFLFGGLAGWVLAYLPDDKHLSRKRTAESQGEQVIPTPVPWTESPGEKMPSVYSRREPIIEIKDFRKTYGDFAAVDGISFEVMRGEIFGLLGPNGAGKTSTLECLEGLRAPTSGSLRVAGIDPTSEPRKLRNLIGVQLQSAGLPESITPDEAMKFFCAYHEVAPRFDLLERMGLEEKRNTQFYELSTGQQRRLGLALAMAHHPQVVFLDEPTAGLDVASRVDLHAMMRDLQAGGATIVLATHDMAEAEEMSDRVAILLNGKIVSIGTPMEITATGAGLTKISVRTQNSSLSVSETPLPAVSQTLVKDEYRIYFSSDIGPTISAIIAAIDAQGDPLIDLRVERPSLEDRFLEITSSGGVQ